MNGRQSHRSNIQQGEMELEFGGKKKEEKEGKYKLKRLVNIIMFASCNHPL